MEATTRTRSDILTTARELAEGIELLLFNGDGFERQDALDELNGLEHSAIGDAAHILRCASEGLTKYERHVYAATNDGGEMELGLRT